MPHALPSLVPASNGTDDGTARPLVAFDRHSRGRFDGRAAVPAVRVLVADGQALVRAGFRALLEADVEHWPS